MKKGRIDEGLQAEHLLQCLEGEPLRIAMMVDLEDSGALMQMWYRLNERFGNEQCDYQHHVSELQKLGLYPQCRTDADLKELYYTFIEHIYAIRRISKNSEAGEDYKTTLCSVLPEYLKRKVLKIMQERPLEYTLSKVMDLVGKQVGLCNMQSVFSGKDNRSAPSSYSKENSNPWTKSRVDAERRAHACAGKLGETQYVGQDYSFHRETSDKSSPTLVTVGQETFSVPGPVARSCYPAIKTQANHYAFAANMTVPPITHYITGSFNQSCALGSNTTSRGSEGWGSMDGNGHSTPHMFQANAAKGGALTNQTIKLDLTKPTSGCVFCNGNHGSLGCRTFELGNQYVAFLKANGRCFNCFEKGHILEYCPAESTCSVQACRLTIKHCPFFCGHFKNMKAYAGLRACSVDAMGNFENARMHTILFLLVNPESGTETLARGFLDSGCTDTFILEKAARRSDLPGLDNRVRFLLSSFTRDKEEGEGSLVKTVFKSLDGRYRSPVLTCITRDSLVQDIDSFRLSEQQLASIEQGGYTLSDDRASGPGRLPVDVVIGMDLYYQFIKGAPVHCAEGLVLVDTVFGYSLGGPVKGGSTVRKHGVNYLKCQLLEGASKPMDFLSSQQNNHLKSAIPERCMPEEEEYAYEKELTSGDSCMFCGGCHEPEHCKIFTSKDQFMQVLKVQQRCYNCFSPNHIVYFCTKPSSCQDLKCARRGKHSCFMCASFEADTHNCAVNGFKLSVEEEQTSLKQLTDVETLGIKENDKEESPITEQFNSEVRKDEDEKRVVIKLLWQHKRKGRLRSNFPHTFERTNNLFEKLSKPLKREIFEEYNNIMEEQVKLGILEKVASIGTVAEVRGKLLDDPCYYDHYMPCHDESQIHYLPHQAVVKASTQKLRVVYDASAKPFKAAFSLNECLETGPSLIQSLADVLTRFRLKKCAFVADIAKAFLQIVVDPCDRDSLRLLWRKGEQVIIYRFNRLPFGLSSSPFVLAATLKYLLKSSELESEEVQAVIRAFYVDDWVSSMDNEDEVLGERTRVQDVLDEGSMRLCKWNSNSIVLKGLFAKGEELLPDVESVLGMIWDTKSDLLHINNSRILKSLGNRNTKEELYSVIAQVFDPMGLLSPYVFVAKRLLQKACLAKLDWKDKLPSDLMMEWETWKSELPRIDEVKYERWVSFEGAEEFELHGFCDASGDGLAANIYLVSKGNSKVQSRLLRSRTRVNSNKPMSMPRRELCATVLLSLVMHIVEEALKGLEVIRKVYYTDSMNALHWILSDSYDWPVFVANRIKQVRALTNTQDWRYVNTTQNPADLPSRGCSIEVLKGHSLYREGPRFLVTGEPPLLGKMDISALPEGCRGELPKVALAAQTKEVDTRVNLRALISTSTASYHEVMKKTKLIYKAVSLMKGKKDPQNWDRKKLELDWIRTVQLENFQKEISYCKAEKTQREKTAPQLVKSLSLFWDAEIQVLRCSSRLQEAQIGYSAANPILIPKEDEFTTMMITAVHQRVGHVGVKQTLSSLRSEFWVPQARRLVKKIVNRCVVCRRVSASPFDLPPPPPLPKCRVVMSRPFSNLGVDFCGPFILKRQKKYYVAVFTCAVTRAVHFEALQDLSAESFLLAFKRFIGRRGVPELIISDNAKTFKCVARKLKKIFDNPALQRYFTERRVRWHFYVERAPWHGGFIETCVKLFKGVFKKLIGRAKLNPEEFRTMVVECEQVVNSRPLTYLYEDLREGQPLTPSKMILGYNLTDLPPIGRGGLNEKLSITKRSKLLERLLNMFWDEWSESYLNELAERHFTKKTGKEEIREPKEGEVVLLRGEPRMPRNRWKLGVIDQVHKSVKGNRIRSVIVRVPEGKGYKGGEFRRSPKHVVPLEAEYD